MSDRARSDRGTRWSLGGRSQVYGTHLGMSAFGSPVGKNRAVIELERMVIDVAKAVENADARGPQAMASRTERTYQPGIGPHSESATLGLVVQELVRLDSSYAAHAFGVPYPDSPRQRCDWCLGSPPVWDWAIEAKLLRLLGDNGKLNDNMLMHLLSPYIAHRSALKLAPSRVADRKAIMIIGYEYDDWPIAPAVEAFEALARDRVELGDRHVAAFNGLIHPVHRRGAVIAWRVGQRR
jgi:hypothetical protein